MGDTKQAFNTLAMSVSTGNAPAQEIFVERMKGMYSYNVLDSADYVQAKKIERRINVYDKKTRDKNKRRVEEHRNEAMKNANALKSGQ